MLAIHFGCTLLYLTPLNPLKMRLTSKLNAYMEPLFAQKWELFAPDPQPETRIFLVACRIPAGDGTVRQTQWIDVTTPLRQRKYAYRLSPADRIDRIQQSAIYNVFGEPHPLLQKLSTRSAATQEKFGPLVEIVEKGRDEDRREGIHLLRRVASAECDRYFGEGRTREVGLRMITRKSPPFSKRWAAITEGSSVAISFGWEGYEKSATY